MVHFMKLYLYISYEEVSKCVYYNPFNNVPILQNCVFRRYVQYIPRNMHTVFALLCFVVVIHWLIFPYPLGLLHWHCGNLTIAPVPAKQPWWIWINTSCEFIMKDCITTTKQSTTKPCAYFLGYTVDAWLKPLFCLFSYISMANSLMLSVRLVVPTALSLVRIICFNKIPTLVSFKIQPISPLWVLAPIVILLIALF